MADIVYLYPKTSCSLGACKGSYSIPQGPPTNLSVADSQADSPAALPTQKLISPYFDCYYKAELQQNIQPICDTGTRVLNPQVYTSKIAEGFDKVGCSVAKGCPQPTFISRDPRQFNAARAEYLPIDTPPIDGDVRLKNIYNEEYDSYGNLGGFQPYANIKDGQIMYYLDRSIADAFYHPVFSEPAEQTLNLYKDPMGAMKPEANRKALINTENPAVTQPTFYPYCLSSIQDSQSFREDLMALQQRKHNQEKWSVRWGNLTE